MAPDHASFALQNTGCNSDKDMVGPNSAALTEERTVFSKFPAKEK